MRAHRLASPIDAAHPHGPLELILCEPTALAELGADGTTRLALAAPRVLAVGLSDRQLRALTAAGCLEKACITPGGSGWAGQGDRSLSECGLQLGLLLTDFGRTILPFYLQHPDQPSTRDIGLARLVSALRHMAERPLWNAQEGELWWQGILVKRFRHDAADQRCVLDALQVRAWMSCNDNPLPRRHGCNRKLQLQNTIRDLNRSQHPLRIHFHGDGRCGIRWEAVAPADSG